MHSEQQLEALGKRNSQTADPKNISPNLIDGIHVRGMVAIPRPLTWASGGMSAVRSSSDALLMAVEDLHGKLDPVRNHPAVLMYYTVDEPDGGITAGLEGFVKMLREVDPYHPVYLGDGVTSA